MREREREREGESEGEREIKRACKNREISRRSKRTDSCSISDTTPQQSARVMARVTSDPGKNLLQPGRAWLSQEREEQTEREREREREIKIG